MSKRRHEGLLDPDSSDGRSPAHGRADAMPDRCQSGLVLEQGVGSHRLEPDYRETSPLRRKQARNAVSYQFVDSRLIDHNQGDQQGDQSDSASRPQRHRSQIGDSRVPDSVGRTSSPPRTERPQPVESRRTRGPSTADRSSARSQIRRSLEMTTRSGSCQQHGRACAFERIEV